MNFPSPVLQLKNQCNRRCKINFSSCEHIIFLMLAQKEYHSDSIKNCIYLLWQSSNCHGNERGENHFTGSIMLFAQNRLIFTMMQTWFEDGVCINLWYQHFFCILFYMWCIIIETLQPYTKWQVEGFWPCMHFQELKKHTFRICDKSKLIYEKSVCILHHIVGVVLLCG